MCLLNKSSLKWTKVREENHCITNKASLKSRLNIDQINWLTWRVLNSLRCIPSLPFFYPVIFLYLSFFYLHFYRIGFFLTWASIFAHSPQQIPLTWPIPIGWAISIASITGGGGGGGGRGRNYFLMLTWLDYKPASQQWKNVEFTEYVCIILYLLSWQIFMRKKSVHSAKKYVSKLCSV